MQFCEQEVGTTFVGAEPPPKFESQQRAKQRSPKDLAPRLKFQSLFAFRCTFCQKHFRCSASAQLAFGAKSVFRVTSSLQAKQESQKSAKKKAKKSFRKQQTQKSCAKLFPNSLLLAQSRLHLPLTKLSKNRFDKKSETKPFLSKFFSILRKIRSPETRASNSKLASCSQLRAICIGTKKREPKSANLTGI